MGRIGCLNIWQSIIIMFHLLLDHREGGDIGLIITIVPKVLYYRFLIRWLDNFGDYYWILIGWLIKLSVQTLPILIVNYRTGNFVYHNWGCTLIYRPLSYPFRSLKTWPLYCCLILLCNTTMDIKGKDN